MSLCGYATEPGTCFILRDNGDEMRILFQQDTNQNSPGPIIHFTDREASFIHVDMLFLGHGYRHRSQLYVLFCWYTDWR